MNDPPWYLALLGLPIAGYVVWTVGRIVRDRLTRQPSNEPPDDEAVSGWG